MSEPLTKDKIRCVPPEYIEEHGCECCCKNTKVMLKDDVLSAVMLLREKVETRKTELEKIRPEDDNHENLIASTIFELMFFEDWINEVFGGVEK